MTAKSKLIERFPNQKIELDIYKEDWLKLVLPNWIFKPEYGIEDWELMFLEINHDMVDEVLVDVVLEEFDDHLAYNRFKDFITPGEIRTKVFGMIKRIREYREILSYYVMKDKEQSHIIEEFYTWVDQEALPEIIMKLVDYIKDLEEVSNWKGVSWRRID